LDKIEFQENGKPVLSGIYFNISHSDHQVICGFSQEGTLGVDLEKIRPIDFEDFTSMFSTKELSAIRGADDPIRTFYWFWTRKESIIKAMGSTLRYLHQIELDVTSDHFVVDGKRYFLRQVAIEEGFVCTVCTEKEIESIELVEIWF
jgi:4'-phosphopantetheinyl transferase